MAELRVVKEVERVRARLKAVPITDLEDAAEGHVELWVARATGTAGTFEVLDAVGAGGDEQVLAVRVTEALRARGLRLEPVANASGGSEAVPAAIRVGRVSPTPTPVRIIPPRTPER